MQYGVGSFLAAFRNTVSILHEQAVHSERKPGLNKVSLRDLSTQLTSARTNKFRNGAVVPRVFKGVQSFSSWQMVHLILSALLCASVLVKSQFRKFIWMGAYRKTSAKLYLMSVTSSRWCNEFMGFSVCTTSIYTQHWNYLVSLR